MASFVFAINLNVNAQISETGIPESFSLKSSEKMKKEIEFKTVKASNLAVLKSEDVTRDSRKDSPWRFGQNIFVNYNPENSGTWDVLPNGDKIWRLGINSPGALSINLTFDKYKLPKGAKLYVYNSDKSQLIGAFTHRNNQNDEVFATTLVKGSAVIIEYNEPANVEFSGKLNLYRITHGYRNVLDYAAKLNTSGACNNNVVCPESSGWEDQIRSVAMMVTGGSGFCTGALINNTNNDGTPLFLTADHCYSDPSSWVFWFNYQSATCTNPTTDPSNNAVSGAVLKARNADSDFCLVQMNSTPPAEYNVFYAGWDKANVAATSAVGIHHPDGDIKKISFENDPLTSTDYLGEAGSIADSHWQIGTWDDGTTEGGSSGSPLFNQNHRIVGQLHGGYASCADPTGVDTYGKLSMSWDRGTTSATRLKDWLDPTNSGVTTVDGLDPNASTLVNDAQISQISIPGTYYCTVQNIIPTVTLKNKGTSNLVSATVSYSIDGATKINKSWTGTLAKNSTITVTFPQIALTSGIHTFEASVSLPNGFPDENTLNDKISTTYNVLSVSNNIEVSVTTDDYGSETSWELIDDATTTVVLSGSGYADISQTHTSSACLGNGCYTFKIYDAYGDGMCSTYGSGSYTVTNTNSSIIYASGCNFTTSETKNFCVVISDPNGIEDLSLETILNVYPNPNNGNFFINLQSEEKGNIQLNIFNIQGKMVFNQSIEKQNNVLNKNLELNNLTKGIYQIQIISNQNIINKTFVIN